MYLSKSAIQLPVVLNNTHKDHAFAGTGDKCLWSQLLGKLDWEGS